MRVPFRLSSPWFRGSRLGVVDLRRLASPAGMSRADHARAVSLLQVFGTTKHTEPGRHAHTDEQLMALLGPAPRILDLGASDGSTSLDFIERLGPQGFERYFVTDKSFDIRAHRSRRSVLFRDDSGRGVALALPAVVVFPQHLPAPLGALIERLGAGEAITVSLVQPDLLRRWADRVVVQAHDAFTPWPGPTVHVVKIANLLNRVYFSDARMAVALGHIHAALEPRGLLAVIDNRESERSTIYRKTADGFARQVNVGAGTDIDDLVVQWRRDP